MSRERVLRQANGQINRDQKEIDRLIQQQLLKQRENRTKSPAAVLKGIDFKKVKLAKREPNIIGTVELNIGSDRPFDNPIYEIPDITIDLTPRSGQLPRNVFQFLLTDGKANLSLNVLFNNTDNVYWPHYGDDKAIEAIVKKNLMSVLPSAEWQLGGYDAWSVPSKP